MGWIGSSGCLYDSKENIFEEFESVCDYELPSRFSEMAKLVFAGEVSSAVEAKELCKRKMPDSGMAYCKIICTEKTKTEQDIENRYNSERKKLEAYLANNNCYDRKSATIGCPTCGSSLSTKYMKILKQNRCPLCDTELRSNTVLNTISSYRKNINKYSKQLSEFESKKGKKSVKWYAEGKFYCG